MLALTPCSYKHCRPIDIQSVCECVKAYTMASAVNGARPVRAGHLQSNGEQRAVCTLLTSCCTEPRTPPVGRQCVSAGLRRAQCNRDDVFSTDYHEPLD